MGRTPDSTEPSERQARLTLIEHEAAPPPPADRPVAGWLVLSAEQWAWIANEIAALRSPAASPHTMLRLMHNEAIAQRDRAATLTAEVARLTEAMDDCNALPESENCEMRLSTTSVCWTCFFEVDALRRLAEERASAAESQRDAALALAREAIDKLYGCEMAFAVPPKRPHRSNLLRAKLDAIATGGG